MTKDETRAQAFENIRKELVRTGRRGNTLLAFRATKKSIEIIEEQSPELFRILVAEKKQATFRPLQSEAPSRRQDADEINLRSPSQILESPKNRQTAKRLQTVLETADLQKRLREISSHTRRYHQERGIHILYLALGFLHWYEDENSEQMHKSPLVLVPALLERSSVRAVFRLRYTGADLGANLVLAERLKRAFNLNLPELPDVSELDIASYFEEVAEQIADQSRWKVAPDEMTLGFFSHGRLQMYEDLNPARWPEGSKPHQHGILSRLLGDGFGALVGGAAVAIDDAPSTQVEQEVEELHLVKDADSSQVQAVKRVRQGANLVIQGPPGTGKSQTITNIIAQAIADNKTVLFVAQKMAALEVVEKRLRECRLQDAVLELHSDGSNRSDLVRELDRVTRLAMPQAKDATRERERCIQLRQQLDDYCSAIKRSILKSDINYVDAFGRFLRTKEKAGEHHEELPELSFVDIKHWDDKMFLEACSSVRRLCEHLERMGNPSAHPFADSALTEFSPQDEKQVCARIEDSLGLLERFQHLNGRLSKEMGLPELDTLDAVASNCRLREHLAAEPNLQDCDLAADDWDLHPEHVLNLIQAGKAMEAVRSKRQGEVLEPAWQADLLNTRVIWATTGQHWWRFLSADFWRAKQKLQGLLKSALPRDPAECLSILDDILEYQERFDLYEDNKAIGERLFGSRWQGWRSDWEALERTAQWVVDFRRLLKETGAEVSVDLPKHLLKLVKGSGKDNWKQVSEQFEQDSEELRQLNEDIRQRLGIPETQSIGERPLKTWVAELETWRDRIKDIYQMTQYNRLCEELDDAGLAELGRLSFDWPLPSELLLTTMETSWYGGLVKEAYSRCAAIKKFDRGVHENILKEYRDLDSNILIWAQEALRLRLHQRRPNIRTPGEMAVIRREIGKKKRHMPIRQLLDKAGRAIQQMKPVFMMSPMSVAAYLKQDGLTFDLVIFDEASQVKVVDALGAILRGKQVVVVGDKQQLPPTRFFDKIFEDDDSDEDEDVSDFLDTESILDLFTLKDAPEEMLRWHYRSRHDSLIAVSNDEFYGNQLLVFPSAGSDVRATGLSLDVDLSTYFERGRSGTNPKEARRIAEAVMEHARTHPGLTLGVVAFSIAQRNRIDGELERLRRENPDCEYFFRKGGVEDFFVKNLENVQGDERDVIFISVGYGRIDKRRVFQSFGPVNHKGGERRLNVLMTRAKLAMRVFSSFSASEMEIKAGTQQGTRVLKKFLHYAETGEMESLPQETGRGTESPFEDAVLEVIEGLGYEVTPQLGSAGYFIDLAVRDPDREGRPYILAVECDGASYHSSATARDRDRLRQEVLEDRGWRFHRIWSTDWYRDAEGEKERLFQAIERAREYYRERDNQEGRAEPEDDELENEEPDPEESTTEAPSQDDPFKTPNYRLFNGDTGLTKGREFRWMGLGFIAEALCKVVAVEAPVHLREAAKRLAYSTGCEKVTKKVLRPIRMAAEMAQQNGKLRIDEKDFLFAAGAPDITVRDRSSLHASARTIDLVCDEEIAEAIRRIKEVSIGASKEDIAEVVCSMLGFSRLTEKTRQRIEDVLEDFDRDAK